MDNALIIDLVLAAVLAVFALLGARKGLIRSLMALVSVVVALIGATLLTAMFVEPVTDLVYPRVEEKVLAQFERDIPSDALAAEDGDLSAGGLLPDELSDLLGEALDTLKRFGVSDDAIDGVTKSVTDSAVSAAERAAYLLVKTIVQAALFLAFFLALMLLLRLLTHGLDRLFSLPVLAQLNGLGGAALELLLGRVRVHGVAVAAHDDAGLVDTRDRVGGGGAHDGGGRPDAHGRDRGGVTLRIQDGDDGLAGAQGREDLVELEGRLREGLDRGLELLEVIRRGGAQAVLDAVK